MRNLKIIGVTGGCGSGKSTVAEMLEKRGGHVIDADKIVVMDSGRIVGLGRHRELMDSCKEYREIYFSQKEEKDTGA